jgi:predicted phosphohydrolase
MQGIRNELKFSKQQQQTHLEEISNKDILIMLEDDAVVAIKDIQPVLEKELSSMTTDHLFLGWCYGRKYMPMCTHAYALTRDGVAKILKYFDTCYSHAIDAQLRHLAEQSVFTWRKPFDQSYHGNLKEGFEDNPNYFTRGLFVQKKGFVSFNHHGFQNNAG